MRRWIAPLALALACGPDAPVTRDTTDGSLQTELDDARPVAGPVEIAVEGDAAWTSTELEVRRGELVRVTAAGKISFDDGTTEVGPDGFGPNEHDDLNTVRCADHAALIARVMPSGAFIIASQEWILVPRAGELAFGPNDTQTENNTGEFTLVIEPDQPVELIEQRGVTVPGSATWIDTGIDVHPDHLIAIDAEGTVDNNIPDELDYGPEGIPDSPDDPYSILDCANHMALIGKIGVGGEPFAVGSEVSRAAADSGRLFLRVNHTVPGGNTGKFSVGVLIGR